MNVGKGHWYFALTVLVLFIGALIWAYGKDKIIHKQYFKGSYKVLIFLLAVLLLVYLFVKIKTS